MTTGPRRGQPGTRRDRLTENEHRFLTGLTVRHLWRGGWWAPKDMISFATQNQRFAGRTPQGLHQTAASLVRKGFAEKIKREGARSPVEYRITSAGRAALSTTNMDAARTAAAYVRGRSAR
jgi:hypothetical protein